MAVAGAVGAVLVGISPLFVKLIGDDLSLPTIGGTLIAAFVTIVGSVGQISTMTWQVTELASGWVKWVVIVLGATTGAVVVVYALKALWYYVLTGARVSA